MNEVRKAVDTLGELGQNLEDIVGKLEGQLGHILKENEFRYSKPEETASVPLAREIELSNNQLLTVFRRLTSIVERIQL